MPRPPSTGTTAPATYIAYQEPSSAPPRLVFEAGLAAIALLFTLFVVGVRLALAAAETRDERDILTAIGAGPATMRRTSGRKAVVLTGLGLALAVPVGFAPVAVVIRAAGTTSHSCVADRRRPAPRRTGRGRPPHHRGERSRPPRPAVHLSTMAVD